MTVVDVAIGVPGGGNANGDGGDETGLELRALMTVLEGCECCGGDEGDGQWQQWDQREVKVHL